MVENHIQDHFDARLVQGLDHGAELIGMRTDLGIDAISRMRREEGHGAVAPIVGETMASYLPYLGIVKFEDRLQFHRGYTQRLEVRNFLDYPQESSGMAHFGTGRAGEAADMHFIDDGFIHRAA